MSQERCGVSHGPAERSIGNTRGDLVTICRGHSAGALITRFGRDYVAARGTGKTPPPDPPPPGDGAGGFFSCRGSSVGKHQPEPLFPTLVLSAGPRSKKPGATRADRLRVKSKSRGSTEVLGGPRPFPCFRGLTSGKGVVVALGIPSATDDGSIMTWIARYKGRSHRLSRFCYRPRLREWGGKISSALRQSARLGVVFGPDDGRQFANPEVPSSKRLHPQLLSGAGHQGYVHPWGVSWAIPGGRQ